MATKKKTNKTVKKTSVSRSVATETQYVIRYHSSLDGEEIYETPVYWSDEGFGWSGSHDDATKYAEDRGMKKLGELLHEEKIVSELINVTEVFNSPVKIGTVVILGGGAEGYPQTVTGVPRIPGDFLTLSVPSGTLEGGVEYTRMSLEDFIEALESNDLEVIWDPSQCMIPATNEDYLDSIGI